MPQLIVMDRTGDSRTAFMPDDAASVSVAQAMFDDFRAKGYIGVKLGADGSRGELIRDFDPNSDVLIYPPYIGG